MDEKEMEEMRAAAQATAACVHEPNPAGVCVYCGGLKRDDGNGYEPPIRRARIVPPHEALDMLVARWCLDSGRGPSSITLMEFMVWSSTGTVEQHGSPALSWLVDFVLRSEAKSFSNCNYRVKRRRLERVLPLLQEQQRIVAEHGIASTGTAFAVIVDLLDGDVKRAREGADDLTFGDEDESYEPMRVRFRAFVSLARAACDLEEATKETGEKKS